MASPGLVSPEYTTLVKCNQLILDMMKQCCNAIGSKLFAKGVIPKNVWEDCQFEKLAKESSAHIVSCVIDRTRHDKEAYHTFMKIIEEYKPWSSFYLEKLDKCYQKEMLIITSSANSILTSQTERCVQPHCLVPVLDEQTRANLDGRLQYETLEIESVFDEFTSSLQQSLEERKVDPVKIAEDLLMIKAVTKQLKAETEVPELFHLIRKDLRNSKTIGEILYHISPYVSFFNYDLVERLVLKRGTEIDKQHFQHYLIKFEEYCQRKATEVPANVDCHDSTSTCFKVKVEGDFQSTYTVKAVNLFRARLCKILGVTEPCLRLLLIQEGCILLTFLLPSFVIPFVFPLTQDQETALSVDCVTRYSIGNAEPFKSIGSDNGHGHSSNICMSVDCTKSCSVQYIYVPTEQQSNDELESTLLGADHPPLYTQTSKSDTDWRVSGLSSGYSSTVSTPSYRGSQYSFGSKITLTTRTRASGYWSGVSHTSSRDSTGLVEFDYGPVSTCRTKTLPNKSSYGEEGRSVRLSGLKRVPSADNIRRNIYSGQIQFSIKKIFSKDKQNLQKSAPFPSSSSHQQYEFRFYSSNLKSGDACALYVDVAKDYLKMKFKESATAKITVPKMEVSVAISLLPTEKEPLVVLSTVSELVPSFSSGGSLRMFVKRKEAFFTVASFPNLTIPSTHLEQYRHRHTLISVKLTECLT